MSRTTSFALVLMAACMGLWPQAARAQGSGIEGTVADTTGGVLPGVTVEISGPNLPDGITVAFTDATGRYSVMVPAGTYDVSFNLPGFALIERNRVGVAESAMTTMDAEMRIGGFAEQVAVVATGTAIDAPAINLPHAVAVVSRAMLQEQGAPQLVDLFKNIGASHGVIGERSSWYNADQAATIAETVANVNLRGLGASRSLVLINGRRQTYVPARLIGGRFVDVNTIPAIAIDRIEVLKEGASATYGSDAVGGVANFVTRRDFRGFEVNVTRDQFDSAGDTTVAGIWGGRIGSSHAVAAAERVGREQLLPENRDWALRPFQGGRGGWSSVGNPGLFFIPTLTGAESPAAYSQALRNAQGTLWDGMPGNEQGFIDPECAAFGGHVEDWTCRFRYQPWDNLIEAQQHTRVFTEFNGPLNDRTRYHVEGMWSEATIPDYYTTPSYPPFPLLYNGVQLVDASHPGRQAFCADYDQPECASADPWLFRGRPVGNSGPERTLRRESRTQRIAGSVDGDLTGNTRFDVGLSYSRSAGNVNIPGIYTERLFLAYRGFGGPNCGVGVTPDASSASGMSLGDLGAAAAGQGNCLYYNPFSNAIRNAQQPGALYQNTANPYYNALLANDPALMEWLNDESDLVSTTDYVVADASVSGNLVENVADFAVGYQYRRLNATGTPNRQGDLAVNPCPIIGNVNCSAENRFGPYSFTNVHSAYDENQTVQRLFAEVALNIGPRLDTQLAANYEIHDVANSFDPKLGWRLQLAESSAYSLSLRGSVQTTFRTPSLDDLNEDPLTTLEYINQTGAYQAVDKFGSRDLEPERAFTYNAGVILFTATGFEATVDYWSYDFENVIGSMPYFSITELYDQGQMAGDKSILDVVSRFILCPDGRASDVATPCAANELERVQIDLVNWPGLKTSGIDTHLGLNVNAGPGRFSANFDATYTVEYTTKALVLEDLVLQPEIEAAGDLNFGNPLATSMPEWKHRTSATYSWGNYSYSNFLNYISGYEDRGSSLVPSIDPFTTWDMTFQWRFPASGLALTVYGLNLTGEMPSWVDIEQSYDGWTHDPKGRRLKVGLTYRFGGGTN